MGQMHWQESQSSVEDASLAATEVDEDTISWERRGKQAFPASQPSSTTDIEMRRYGGQASLVHSLEELRRIPKQSC